MLAKPCGKTWLSLGRWAEIMGINPFNFNQLDASSFFPSIQCGEIFFEFSWQHADRVGRQDICDAIQQAESEMVAEAGFNFMPDWTAEERLEYPHPGMPGVYGVGGTNPRGMLKSVEAKRGYIISGGIRTKTLLQAAVPIVRSDVDGDSYNETCTVVTPVTFTDTNEVHIYYPSQDGDDSWEIRPIKVAISGGNATITFKVWLVPLATKLFEANAQPLDANNIANFETTVDVYRVYNDPSTQLQFMWEPDEMDCTTGTSSQFSTQAGSFHLRDDRLGILVPAPGAWDAATSSFLTADWAVSRDPDQVRLWYYSGYIDRNLPRPYAELSPYWEYAIAYFAASKLDRPVCGCSNINEFVNKWRRDAAFSSMEEGGFKITAEEAANKLGTSAGALYAYKQIHRNGVRIIK